MLDFRRFFYHRLKIVADLFLITLSFYFSSYLSKSRIYPQAKWGDIRAIEIILWLILIVVWIFTSGIVGLYDEFRSRYFSVELIATIKQIAFQLIFSILILFFFKEVILSRYFLVSYILFLFGSLFGDKLFLRLLLYWLRTSKRNLRSVLIIGTGDVGKKYYDFVIQNRHLGYYVIGFLDDTHKGNINAPYLGKISQLDSICDEKCIDEVIITLPSSEMERIEWIINKCKNHTTHVRIVPDYLKYISNKYQLTIYGNLPIISVLNDPLGEPHWRVVKRFIDLAVTLLLFVLIFSWLWPLIAVAIKLDSPGSIFFKQERWGKKNKRFVCYKFRSMKMRSQNTDRTGKYKQATRNDPRFTRIGKFLRRLNLDEIAQFLNVLKGEMSIVGPRPHPIPLNLESKDRIQYYMMRHLVKPGITGWAQVNGFRGETKDPQLMQQRVNHDMWYIENWRPWLDVQIILLTIWQMIKGHPEVY